MTILNHPLDVQSLCDDRLVFVGQPQRKFMLPVISGVFNFFMRNRYALAVLGDIAAKVLAQIGGRLPAAAQRCLAASIFLDRAFCSLRWLFSAFDKNFGFPLLLPWLVTIASLIPRSISSILRSIKCVREGTPARRHPPGWRRSTCRSNPLNSDGLDLAEYLAVYHRINPAHFR